MVCQLKKHHNMITTYYIKLKSWKLNYSLTKSFSSQISLIILRSIMYLLQNCRFSHLYSSLNKKGKRKRFPLNNHWQVAIMYHYSKSTNILHPLCGCPCFLLLYYAHIIHLSINKLIFST